MFRILQGDVGSGKTIVSLLLSMANAIEIIFNVLLWHQTEILSNQHFKLAKKILTNCSKFNIEFLTGKTDYKKKKFLAKNLNW